MNKEIVLKRRELKRTTRHPNCIQWAKMNMLLAECKIFDWHKNGNYLNSDCWNAAWFDGELNRFLYIVLWVNLAWHLKQSGRRKGLAQPYYNYYFILFGRGFKSFTQKRPQPQLRNWLKDLYVFGRFKKTPVYKDKLLNFHSK